MKCTTQKPALSDGSIFRHLVRLTTPMLISALLQNAQSMIDLFWVGRLGTTAVAAVAISGILLMLLFPALMGLSTGTVALVARAVGGHRTDDARAAATQSIFMAVILGILIGSIGWTGTTWLLKMLNTPADVMPQAVEYMQINFLGAVTVFVLFVGNAAMQGAGDMKSPMYIMLIANALNLILDPLFIFGIGPFPRMGVAGAALATVLAQAAAAGIAIHLLSRGRSHLQIDFRKFRPDIVLCRRILRIGIPGSGQMLGRSLMNAVFMYIVAGFGTVAVAAYGIALRYHMIVLMPAFALGGAAATMVGQNLGAGKPDRARHAAWLATAIDLAVMAVSAAILIVFAPHLIRVFNDHDEVVAIGTTFMRIVSPCFLPAALAIVLGRALNGAGDSIAPMIITILSLWGLQIPLALWFAHLWPEHIVAAWWAIAIAMIVNGIATAVWFETGRWKHTRI